MQSISRLRLAALCVSATALLVASPYSVRLTKSGFAVQQLGAWAKDGHGGSGSSGSGGGSGSSGSGSGGSGSGKSGSGSSSSGSSGSSSGSAASNSGSGSMGNHGAGRRGADDGARHAGDDRGRNHRGAVRGNDDPPGDDRRADHHVNPATGARVEINGNSIEVVHPDGTKEEIDNGRFERKNAAGRTVVERPASAADAARLRAFGG